MHFAFTDEQEELRRYVREWLSDRSPMTAVRRTMDQPEGFDRGLWQEMAELGWLGIAVGEEHGGEGFGFLELAVLLEEHGRALFPSPYLSTVVMGASLLSRHGTADQRDRWLPRIAGGESIVAVAQAEPAGTWDEDGVQAIARPREGGWLLSGTKSFVVDGHAADLLIVAARTASGVSLFLVDAGADGVQVRRLPAMDRTRPLATVTLDAVLIPDSALLGEEGSGWAALTDLAHTTAVALALEQVGGAAACTDMAVAYAKERRQFGRAIGSFQAVKHKCADMHIRVETARSAAYYAAWASSEDSDEIALVAPLAASHCAEAFFACAAENLQIHGGIGFTWEHDAHLYLKRAKSSELLFGAPAQHRGTLAERLGL